MKKIIGIVSIAMLCALMVSPAVAHIEWDPVETDLFAGQHTDVGTLRVWNDANNLYVAYIITSSARSNGWALTETHLYVGDEPPKKSAPGRFPYKRYYDNCTRWWDLYTIPLSEVGEAGDEIIVAAHGVIAMMDNDCEPIMDETIWAQGTMPIGKGRNWATGFAYVIQEDVLEADEGGMAAWTMDAVYRGFFSAYLSTGDSTPAGTEARVVIPMPAGTTLGDLASISWWELLVGGYPPHVDVVIMPDKGGVPGEDRLVFEYAYNNNPLGPPPTYGAVTGDWYQTFNDDGEGAVEVDDAATGWLASGPAGPMGAANFATLGAWKAGVSYDPDGAGGVPPTMVDSNTAVTAIEIEIDNWLSDTDAYVDDVDVMWAP